jgi:anti-sigma B factor antagonist
MKFKEKKKNDILCIEVLESRFVSSSSHVLKERMTKLIAEGNRFIIFDLSPVSFIDSSGLGIIMSTSKSIKKEGEVLLCCLQTAVRETLDMTKISTLFKIFETRKEAEKYLTDKASLL